jgi:hypothetical protein
MTSNKKCLHRLENLNCEKKGEKLSHKKETCLKMEISQSQDWVGNAMKKQTAALNHTIATIAMAYLDNF